MAVDDEGNLRRAGRRRLLALILIGGFTLILLGESQLAAKWPELLRVFVGESGKAFVVAGVLGLVIDESLKQDLIRNAVSAALGYLLPERLKPELGWIYSQKVMAEQCFHVRLEHFPEEHGVVFHGTVVRRVENVCGESTRIVIGGGTDEWFSSHGESTITACEWKRIAKDRVPVVTKLDSKRQLFGIGYDVGAVDIGPDEIIETLMSYTLSLPDHGMELLTYRFAIDRPSVTVEAPASLKYFVTFSHRDKYDQDAIGDSPVFSTRLDRVLLPHQDIRVYWHSAEDVAERANKYGLKM